MCRQMIQTHHMCTDSQHVRWVDTERRRICAGAATCPLIGLVLPGNVVYQSLGSVQGEEIGLELLVHRNPGPGLLSRSSLLKELQRGRIYSGLNNDQNTRLLQTVTNEVPQGKPGWCWSGLWSFLNIWHVSDVEKLWGVLFLFCFFFSLTECFSLSKAKRTHEAKNQVQLLFDGRAGKHGPSRRQFVQNAPYAPECETHNADALLNCKKKWNIEMKTNEYIFDMRAQQG